MSKPTLIASIFLFISNSSAICVAAEDSARETVQLLEAAFSSFDEDEAPPERFAIVVGASEYRKDDDGPVHAANDANLIRDALVDRCQFPSGQVTVLTGLRATEDRILREIAATAVRASPDDLFLFFYSGRGDAVPGDVDFRTANWKREYSYTPQSDSLRRSLMDLPVRRKFIFIDADYVSGFRDVVADASRIRKPEEWLPLSGFQFSESQPDGTVVCLSSRGDQPSLTIRRAENQVGVFAAAFVDVLKVTSRTGLQLTDEFFDSLPCRVESLAEESGGAMHPEIQGSCRIPVVMCVDAEKRASFLMRRASAVKLQTRLLVRADEAQAAGKMTKYLANDFRHLLKYDPRRMPQANRAVLREYIEKLDTKITAKELFDRTIQIRTRLGWRMFDAAFLTRVLTEKGFAEMYSRLTESDHWADVKAVNHALRLAAPALDTNPGELWSQLDARLPHPREGKIARLLSDAKPAVAFRVIAPVLPQSGGQLDRILLPPTGNRGQLVPEVFHVTSESDEVTLAGWPVSNGPSLHRWSIRRQQWKSTLPQPRSQNPDPVLLQLRKSVFKADFSHDGDFMLALDAKLRLTMWKKNAQSPLMVFNTMGERPVSICLSADGAVAAACIRNKGTFIWGMQSAAPIKQIKFEIDDQSKPLQKVESLELIDQGRTLMAGFADRVQLLDVESAKLVNQIMLPVKVGDAPTIDPNWIICRDESRISACSDSTCFVWERESGNLVRQLANPGTSSLTAFSHDGNKLAIGGRQSDFGESQDVKIYDLKSGRQIAEFDETDRVQKIAFSSAGDRLLAANGGPATVSVWNLLGKPPDPLDAGSDGPEVRATSENSRVGVKLPRSSKTVNFGAGHSLRLLDGDGKLLRVLSKRVRQNRVLAMPDGQHIVTSNSSGNLHLWNVDSGKMVASICDVRFGNVAGRTGNKIWITHSSGEIPALEVVGLLTPFELR